MGGTLPEEGEMVVIQENQTILLDVSTPILGMLLIQGNGGKHCTPQLVKICNTKFFYFIYSIMLFTRYGQHCMPQLKSV